MFISDESEHKGSIHLPVCDFVVNESEEKVVQVDQTGTLYLGRQKP